MAASRWGMVLAGALVAAALPAAAVTGAQAALPSANTAATAQAPSAEIKRVQPRLISEPESQWAILATSNVTDSIQPVILGQSTGTRADDSIFVGYEGSTTQMGVNLNWNLSTSQVVSASRLQWAARPTAAQGDDTTWMTLDFAGQNPELASINRTTGTVARYPLRVTGFNPLRALRGLVIVDDTAYVGYQTTGNTNDVQAGILKVSTRNPQDDSTVLSGLSVQKLNPGQLAKTSGDDTLILAMYPFNETPQKQILVASPRQTTTTTRLMPWYSMGAAAGDDTIYISQSGGNGLAAINPSNLDDSRIVSVTGAGQFGYISVWKQRVADDTIDTVFLPATSSNALWMVNGRTLLLDDSVALDAAPSSVTAAAADVAYVAGSKVWAVGVVSGQTVPNSSSTPLTGVKDDSIAIDLTLPTLFTQNAALVTDVWLDDSVTTRAALVRQGNTITAKVPPGTGGPYSVIVGLNGGNRIKVGEFTYNNPTPPSPPTPPAPAPTMTPISQVINGIVGTAIPPTSRFTLENFTLIPRYSVYPALPSGLSIDPVTGVVSGTPTVVYPSTRHWITASSGGNSESASSTLQVTISPAPTPPPPPPVTRSLVLNQGERTKGKGSIHDRITTTGSSTGIDPGTRLTPYIRYSGQSTFAEGRATIVVQADGTFRWTREIRRNRDVTGYVAFEDLKSNQVTWVKLQ